MAGILDFLQGDDMRLGLGLLAAGGPSTTQMDFGQRLAGAVQSVDAQKDADMKRQYVMSQIDQNKAQIAAANLKAQKDAQIQALIQSRLSGGAPPAMSGSPSSMPSPGGFDIGVNPGAPNMGGMPATAPQAGAAQSSQGGRFPFSLNDISALGVMGAPGADMLFNAYKYSTDGVKQEAGNYYNDPTTGQTRYLPKVDPGMTVDGSGNVSPLSGYSAANAGIKGQEAQAIAGARMPYDIAADRARQTTGAQLDTVDVIGEDGNTYKVPRYNVATGQGATPGGLGGASGAPGGVSIGGSPSGRGGFMSSRNPITQQSATALNDDFIKNSYRPTVDAGKAATDIQNSIQAVRSIDLNTGWGADQKAAGAAMLEGLGIAPGSAKLFAANAQKFQSIAMDRLQTSLVAQKGTQTEGDADRAGKTFASIKNTPEANTFILDFAQAKANMDQRKAQYFQDTLPLAQKAGDLTAVERRWKKVQGSVWEDPVMQRWSK